MKYDTTLPVIFRVSRDKSREVVAVFPTLPFDYAGRELACYTHTGQHSGCSLTWYHSFKHRLAKPSEYRALLRELRGIYGHSFGPDDPRIKLIPVQRITRAHRKAFDDAVKRFRLPTGA